MRRTAIARKRRPRRRRGAGVGGKTGRGGVYRGRSGLERREKERGGL